MSTTLHTDAREVARRRYYADHPVAWMRDYLNLPPWNFIWSQAGKENPETVLTLHGGVDPYEGHAWAGMKDPLFQAMQAMARGERRVVVVSGTGVSKCVREDTLVYTDRGLRPIKDVVAEAGPVPDDAFAEHAVGVVGRDGPEAASHVYSGGVQRVWDVTTASGLRVGGTGTHRLLVLRDGRTEWAYCKDLAVGDYVVAYRGGDLWASEYVPIPEVEVSPWGLPVSLPEVVNEDVAYFLGLMAGDGCYAPSAKNINAFTFTSEDPESLEWMGSTLASWGIHFRKTHKARQTYELRFSRKALWDTLEGLGVSPSRSEDKSVPWCILQSPKPVVRAFLQGLFDTDGYAMTRGGEVGISLAAEQLVGQVQILLLNFGIVSRKSVKATTVLDSHRLFIGGEDAARFYDEVGFRLERKQSRRSFLAETRNTNVDLVPGVGGLVREVYEAVGTAVNAATRHNVSGVKHPLGPDVLGKPYNTIRSWWRTGANGRSPSRDRLQWFLRLAAEAAPSVREAEAFRALADLVERPYFFDPVVSVEEGEDRVYDLSVPGTHSFVANGVVNHNSFVAGALSLWYLDTHMYSRWAAFAPKKDQIKKEGYFAEVHKLISEPQFRGPKGGFKDLYPRCKFVGDWFFVDQEAYGTRWAAFVRAASVKEGEDSSTVTQGLHHPNLVAYLEEFPGIKDAVKAAILKTLSDENNQLFIVGNPKYKGDALEEMYRSKRSFGVQASPKDFPNIVLGAQVIPGATSRTQFEDLRHDAAQNLGIDLARLEPGHPDPPGEEELARDPHYKVAVLGQWPSVRADTYIPAARFTSAEDHLVGPEAAVSRTVFEPSAALPLEGAVTVYKRPVWEGEDGGLLRKQVWRRRYVVHMDTASSYEVTPTNAGDRNKKDWHTAVVFDTVEKGVVALARTRGLIHLHTLAAMWLCDRFTLRYPRTPEEAGRGPSEWTGYDRPLLSWERNAEGNIPNMAFPTGADARALGLIGPEALGLPRGRHGWPWASVRQYGMGNLYRPLSDSKDPALSALFGVLVTGGNRGDLVAKVAEWATRIPTTPWVVRSPELFSEMGTFIEKEDGGGKVKVEHADDAHDDVLFGLAGCIHIADDLAGIGKGPVSKPWPEPVSAERSAAAFRERRKAQGARGPFSGRVSRSFSG